MDRQAEALLAELSKMLQELSDLRAEVNDLRAENRDLRSQLLVEPKGGGGPGEQR